jgi:hypothetical protein
MTPGPPDSSRTTSPTEDPPTTPADPVTEDPPVAEDPSEDEDTPDVGDTPRIEVSEADDPSTSTCGCGCGCGCGSIMVPAGSPGAYVYSAPSLTSAKVGALAAGANVAITCTTRGQTVSRPDMSHSSNLWDWVGSGFVSDMYVDTGTTQPVAPPCR